MERARFWLPAWRGRPRTWSDLLSEGDFSAGGLVLVSTEGFAKPHSVAAEDQLDLEHRELRIGPKGCKGEVP
jgi:hypothetical protein